MSTAARIWSLLLPRLPRMLLLAPLLAFLVVGSAMMLRSGEWHAWYEVKMALYQHSAMWDAPESHCPEGVQARIEQIHDGSIFALQRRRAGRVPTDAENAELDTCIRIARANARFLER
jgi:hypothetical protein